MNNIFESRGCKYVPKSFTKNENLFSQSCCKMSTYDWLSQYEQPKCSKADNFNIVEVRFKNNKSDFFIKPNDLLLEEGDIVAVEASPGHDIGIVNAVGCIVKIKLKNKKKSYSNDTIKKLYRRAKATDIDKWISAVEIEESTKMRSRTFASDLNLKMKISDVEYQGDKTKAIFYYTADERVDFRELIKCFAEAFSVRVEMKQIGVRQEASRIGGLGSCGRELCCSTWLSNFKSVSTNAARTQQLSLNPQKLAGQCSKLKCCLNFENDLYLETLKEFPHTSVKLLTKSGDAVFQKIDILKKVMWFAYESDLETLYSVPLQKVNEIIAMNKNGILADVLINESIEHTTKSNLLNYSNEEDDISRFDKK